MCKYFCVDISVINESGLEAETSTEELKVAEGIRYAYSPVGEKLDQDLPATVSAIDNFKYCVVFIRRRVICH